MRHMILIGGGEIGGPCPPKGLLKTPFETLPIDSFFVSLIKKDKPKLLFLPTATEERDPTRGYEKAVRNYFHGRFGMQVDSLYLIQEHPSYPEIKQKISSTDCIYIGGGDTKALVDAWNNTGATPLIKDAIFSGKPVAGVSAGAICWFEMGISNYRRIRYGEKDMAPVEGLGILKGYAIAHYHREENVLSQIEKIIPKGTKKVCWGIDDFAALYIKGNKKTGLFSNENSGIYKISSHKSVIREQIVFSGRNER
ncbi:MAG: Type 1 glutamine amidotransferase-like domain-containing protein [Pseudomonadota bacterium]|nr:Type 1 glutamine amidotransferase-like domain-containing protein [Pseudomonadota bacterium]